MIHCINILLIKEDEKVYLWVYRMKKALLRIIILALISISLIQLPAFAQPPKTKNSFTLKVCFGGIQSGVISKYEHLEDSLAFTDSLANDMLRITSFKLALACNGNVVKYFENKSGNKLTAEMKDGIREMHPGCTIAFQGIKTKFKQKGLIEQDTKLDHLLLKLTLKN